MSLAKILCKGVGVALDAPLLRALAGSDPAGRLIAGVAGPVYHTIRDHFTLSGRDLAEALGDSFARGLSAIDDELNGWRISNALGAKLRRDYQARIRRDFLQPYAAQQALGESGEQHLCQAIKECAAHLLEQRSRLFPPAEMPEPAVADLLGGGDEGGVSELLLARIEQVDEPLPLELRAFLGYRDLLGDAVLYFFRERLRRDPRVETTLNALQQAGLRRDARGLDERLDVLQQQQSQLQSALAEALQARDRARRDELLAQTDRLDKLLDEVSAHRQRLQTFNDQFADWSGYLDVRMDELQGAVVSEIRQLGVQVHHGLAALQQRFDALLQQLQAAGLGERIRPDDEFHPPSERLLSEVEQSTAALRQSPQHRARAAIVQASVLAAAGDTRRAEAHLSDALEHAASAADRALAHYNLFQLHLQRGALDDALSQLRRAAELEPGYALWRPGKHTPERILGAGGMGIALLVRDRLERQRVLKLLWSDDAAAAERFHREALSLHQVAGAHVPEVYDFDHADPIHQRNAYVEMAYLPETLDGEAWLKRYGPLTLAQALALGVQVAEVLQLAHAQGITHNDLKPANLLLRATAAGLQVSVIDFGLSSKVIELQRRLGRGSTSGKSIMAQQVFGSLDYAPPEQRGLGGEPGPWSDLYSLAITLYRLLTGAPPQPPNPLLLPDDRELQQLLFQCLHHDPSQRPASAGELKERLQALLDAPTPATTGNAAPFVHGWSAEAVQRLQRATAQRLGLELTFRDRLRDGSAGPEMVVIPAGRFVMGSPEDEEAHNDDERQHEVTIAQPFGLGRYPVTFAEYDRFCTITGRELTNDKGWGRDRRPVIYVNWHDAMAYCGWLAEMTGCDYRLASEAEWEYACRAGTTSAFYFGETLTTDQANYDDSGEGGNYREQTTPVGQFPANAWGLHDMHGNVWEWTGSGYDEGYTGPEQWCLEADAAEDIDRVVRGGSWYGYRDYARAAYRVEGEPEGWGDDLGFRVVRGFSSAY